VKKRAGAKWEAREIRFKTFLLTWGGGEKSSHNFPETAQDEEKRPEKDLPRKFGPSGAG